MCVYVSVEEVGGERQSIHPRSKSKLTERTIFDWMR